MRYSFAAETAPSARTIQYFETVGHRGIYSHGWKAVTAHVSGTSFDDDQWELYNLEEDFSEVQDRSDDLPEQLRALEELWWREARAYGVLPLDDRMSTRVSALDPRADRLQYVMLPGTRLLNHVVGPSFSERTFEICADVRLTEQDEGVLVAYGRRAHGFSFFVKNGRLVLDYNLAGRHTILTSAGRIPTGDRLLRLRIEGDRHPVSACLLIEDYIVARADLPRLVPGGIGTLSLQCGHNAPSPVSEAYAPPFTFGGTLRKLLIDLEPRVDERDTRMVQTEMGFQ
jgi:hypothetical protein